MKVLFAITRVYHTPAYFTNSSLHSHVSANSLRTYPLGGRPLSVELGCCDCHPNSSKKAVDAMQRSIDLS